MRPRRVLIVEDHGTQADGARRVLEESGYTVRVVEGGTSGLEVAQTWDPDAILMDVGSGSMSGLEAVSLLRHDPRTQAIPVIATTLRPAAGDFARGFLAGFARYLTKPLSRRGLLEALDELIDARARRDRPPLAGDVEDLAALIEIEDREQVLAGLLDAVRRRVPCDVLALRCQDAGVPHVLLSLPSPMRHSVLLGQMAPDLGIDPHRLARLRVVTNAAAAPMPPDAPSLRSHLTVPLSHGDQAVGLLVLGSLSRAFEAPDEQRMNELSAALGRVCCRGLHLSAPPAPIDFDPAEPIEMGLLLPDTAEMIFWQGRIEACLPGVRVHIFASPDGLAESRAELHVVLVAPAMRTAAEVPLRARSRLGRSPFPIVDLRPADVGSRDELLRAMLLMALLGGFGEGRRSGCLRFAREDGGVAGEIVFRDGRVDWAAREGSDADLLGRLAERSNAGRSVFVRTVQRALDDGKTVLETLPRDGVIQPEILHAVVRDYVSTIIRELLHTPLPTVSISSSLPPSHPDASFELSDLALGLFDA